MIFKMSFIFGHKTKLPSSRYYAVDLTSSATLNPNMSLQTFRVVNENKAPFPDTVGLTCDLERKVALTLRTWRFSANPITDVPLKWTNERATWHSASPLLIRRIVFSTGSVRVCFREKTRSLHRRTTPRTPVRCL